MKDVLPAFPSVHDVAASVFVFYSEWTGYEKDDVKYNLKHLWDTCPFFMYYAAHNSLGWISISELGHPPLRSLSISQESTDSARVVHSLDNPTTLPVKSGLQVRF